MKLKVDTVLEKCYYYRVARIAKANKYGEVSEWFKELVLKTSDTERYRGFESHLLRHIRLFGSHWLILIWRSTQEAEGARLESE